MDEKINSIITSGFIGIAAYMVTDVVHEVIGHSSAALLAGYDITLLTSVYFKSNPINFIIGLCGPISNLFFGILLFTILRYATLKSAQTKLLLTTLMAYNLFWFSGTIVQSGFVENGDWTYAVTLLNMRTLDKSLLLLAGIVSYFFSIKIVASRISILNFNLSEITLKQSIYYAYFFGILAAMGAGLFYAPDSMAASREGLLEMMASLPILFLVRRINQETEHVIKVDGNLIFYLSVCVAYILFCFMLGKGIY